MRDEDVFMAVRARRDAFCRRWPGGLGAELLNHGAPRAPELELEPGAPDYVRAYLAEILGGRRDVLIKCVRLHRKLALLRDLDPNASLLHIVREPRAVTTSHLWGKGRPSGGAIPTRRRLSRRGDVLHAGI